METHDGKSPENYQAYCTVRETYKPLLMVIAQFRMVGLLRFIYGLSQAQCLTSLMVW